jgi:hypothetical protein
MNRTARATVLLFIFILSGCDISWWRYRFEQAGRTPTQTQIDQLHCKSQLKEGDKLESWWVIDEQIEGCMREKGYRYVQAEAIIP